MELLNTSRILLLLLMVTVLCTCSTKNESTSKSGASNYRLDIVDSVQVDLLAKGPQIMDVHPGTGDLLLTQSSPPKLWIVSPNGEIKTEWAKSGNGPDEIGNALLCAEFVGDGVAMMGYMQVKVFDKEFKTISSYKADYSLQGMLYTGFNHLMTFKNESHLVAFTGGAQTEARYDSPEYYNEYNVVDVIDISESLNQETQVKGKAFKPIGKLEADSRFKTSGRAFFYIKPVFDVKNDMLIYGFNWDTTLVKRNLPTGELISKTSIPFDQFYLNQGWTMGKAGQEMRSGNNPPRDRAGNVERVLHADGFDLIFYRSGLSLEKVNEVKLEGRERILRLLRLDYPKYLVLQDGKRVNTELRMNRKYSTPSMADDRGYVWAAQNINELEEEPDLITYYKLKVVSDE